jgi:hypothetical protein
MTSTTTGVTMDGDAENVDDLPITCARMDHIFLANESVPSAVRLGKYA